MMKKRRARGHYWKCILAMMQSFWLSLGGLKGDIDDGKFEEEVTFIVSSFLSVDSTRLELIAFNSIVFVVEGGAAGKACLAHFYYDTASFFGIDAPAVVGFLHSQYQLRYAEQIFFLLSDKCTSVKLPHIFTKCCWLQLTRSLAHENTMGAARQKGQSSPWERLTVAGSSSKNDLDEKAGLSYLKLGSSEVEKLLYQMFSKFANRNND